MRAITKNVVEFLKKEDGPTAVEYAVMLALIIVVCITAITALGSNANNTFSYVSVSVLRNFHPEESSTRVFQRLRLTSHF